MAVNLIYDASDIDVGGGRQRQRFTRLAVIDGTFTPEPFDPCVDVFFRDGGEELTNNAPGFGVLWSNQNAGLFVTYLSENGQPCTFGDWDEARYGLFLAHGGLTTTEVGGAD